MHIWRRAMLLVAPAAAGLGLVGAPAAFGAHAAQARPAGTSHPSKAQTLKVVIKDVTTSEGSEPAFVGPSGVGAKTLFTAHVGRPVVLTVVNHSTTLHSLTVAGLGVNAIIVPGATVKVKFTPKKAGALTWLCTPPCGTWVMSNDGYMKGYLKVMKT